MMSECPTCGYPFDETESKLFNNGWISVEDRLPEDNVEVMVNRKDNGFWWGVISKANGLFFVRFGNDWMDVSDVTHWMPLPEPPDEGGLMMKLSEELRECKEQIADLMLEVDEANDACKELEHKIDKLKCCENCKHTSTSFVGWTESKMKKHVCYSCEDFDNWQMKEDEL